jgi:hypothetical protein
VPGHDGLPWLDTGLTNKSNLLEMDAADDLIASGEPITAIGYKPTRPGATPGIVEPITDIDVETASSVVLVKGSDLSDMAKAAESGEAAAVRTWDKFQDDYITRISVGRKLVNRPTVVGIGNGLKQVGKARGPPLDAASNLNYFLALGAVQPPAQNAILEHHAPMPCMAEPSISRDFGRRSRQVLYRSTRINWLMLAERRPEIINVSPRPGAFFPYFLGFMSPKP